jgi:hypothetical protein
LCPVALISILMNCVLQTGQKATSLEYRVHHT